MAIVQNLYQIFKLPASYIVANDCDVKKYTITNGLKDGNIVSIGDNIVFQQIRYIRGDERSHEELFSYIQKLRNSMHAYKKEGCYKEASILDRRITDVLFVRDIINVIVDKKKSDFHKFRTKGFYVNGIHYVYLCSGSGQIRRNTATFINEEIAARVIKTINCGLDEKTSEFCLAKYSAYFALAFSSILWVRTPRVCVIKDFFHTLPDQKVDFICKNDAGESIIEERTMNIDLNCADGQGLIDPEFAIKWSEDMHLSYVPCSFVARSCFIKGNLATFDFKEYAHKHGISTIRDRWGVEYNIDDIDVLLSESQFKTYKYYSSWDEYQEYAKKGNIHWGVARYNKKKDQEYVLANYQYIQALNLSNEDIRALIAPTVNWIKDICSGDTLAALLYCFGVGSNGFEYDTVYNKAQTTAMRAIIKNVDFLEDTYIQKKIYKNITESINHAKIGKVWVRGNYQFMVADPVAQCQAALGLETTGVVPADKVWSKFWIDRKPEGGQVDLCRSPMIDQHEHNPSDLLADNEDANYWLRYLYSGIVYSTWDTATARHEDADFDGDIVMSTDNEQFIKGSNKHHNIITYEKGLAKPEKMTIPNITRVVSKGFGTGVGGFSNTATCLYAMAAIFDKPGHEDQRDEILTRIKLLREIVGQEIDRIKGADKPSLPKAWKSFEKIDPDDDPAIINEKMRRNAMVVSKKPYFFRYLYPELNQRFKQFEASYNQVSRDLFGIKFKKLLKKTDKTEEEQMLVKRYQKYSPLITSPCTMNRLCREFESIDFDIQFNKDSLGHKKPLVSMLPTFEFSYADKFSEDKYNIVKKMYQEYSSKKQIKYLTTVFEGGPSDITSPAYSEYRSSVYKMLVSDLQSRLTENDISGEEFLFYCNRLAPAYANFNWAFAWDVLDDQIISLIPQGRSFCPVCDTENTPGGIEYLGRRYILKDISKDSINPIQDLSDLFFSPDEFDDSNPFADLGDELFEQLQFTEEGDDSDVE